MRGPGARHIGGVYLGATCGDLHYVLNVISPSLIPAMCLYCRHPPPDACAKNNMDCYMFKCRFIQKYVPLNHEMKNCSNVDQNGNCRTRANLKYSHNKITFVIAVTAVMSRSLVTSDRPTGYIHNTFCSNS